VLAVVLNPTAHRISNHSKTGLKIKNRLLKYNGRPFHSDELNNLLKNMLI